MAAETTLEVRCFGTFSFRCDGDWETGPAAFKRGREFLQYMTTYPRAIASREALADAFWPDSELDDVTHRLHLAAAGARAALRPVFPAREVIRCIGGAYAWHSSVRVISDYAELLACYREATVESMKRGVALYTGDYCAGDDAEWMYALRARASCAYVAMLERLAEDALAAADHSSALDYALRLVEADRGHEGAVRSAMRSFAALGRRSAAIAEYDALHRWLARHLGVEPSRATLALRREIVAGD